MADDEGRLSILGNLEARHKELEAEQHVDLKVARWSNPEIYVRYKPVGHARIRNVQLSVEKAPDKQKADREMDGNIGILIEACTGVYAVIDGEQYSLRPGDPRGAWTTFDDDLAKNLGLPPGVSSKHVLRKLFLADGDILSHVDKLGEWSGYTKAEVNEQLEGES